MRYTEKEVREAIRDTYQDAYKLLFLAIERMDRHLVLTYGREPLTQREKAFQVERDE